MKVRGDVHANKCCYNFECPVGRYYFWAYGKAGIRNPEPEPETETETEPEPEPEPKK